MLQPLIAILFVPCDKQAYTLLLLLLLLESNIAKTHTDRSIPFILRTFGTKTVNYLAGLLATTFRLQFNTCGQISCSFINKHVAMVGVVDSAISSIVR
jgi:hypothetical protein